MTQQGNEYRADNGKTFIAKSTGDDMGTILCLGIGDNIDNYEEVEMVEIVEKMEDENENSI